VRTWPNVVDGKMNCLMSLLTSPCTPGIDRRLGPTLVTAAAPDPRPGGSKVRIAAIP
jgi:hypothetical protein